MIKKQKHSDLDELDFRTFLYPLTENVWTCMFFTSSLIVITKLILDNSRTNVLETFWSSLASNFGGDFDHHNNSRNAYKVTTFVALFFGNFIWMGYQASLTVDLSSPSNKLPFNNLETFLGSSWSLHTLRKE